MARLQSVCLIGCVAVLCEARYADPASAEEQKTPAELIVALASRNPAPKLVKARIGAGNAPLFSQDYDWDDYKRVGRAWRELDSASTPDVWEELLKHLDDKRYSLTLDSASPGLPGGDDVGENFSVGDVCRTLAQEWLTYPVKRHAVDANVPTKPWAKIVPSIVLPDLAEWRKARATKTLYELQIEVCELALAELESLKATAEQKRQIRAALQAELDQLKTTKRPVLPQRSICGIETWFIKGWFEAPSYSTGKAQKLRAKYANQAGLSEK
jgi:hypothetical protein